MLIRFADAARSMLAEIGARGNDGDADWSDPGRGTARGLGRRTRRCHAGGDETRRDATARDGAEGRDPVEGSRARSRGRHAETQGGRAGDARRRRGRVARRVDVDDHVAPAHAAVRPVPEGTAGSRRTRSIARCASSASATGACSARSSSIRACCSRTEVLEALSLQGAPSVEEVTKSTIRVDLMLVERLINQVGELVLVRNQIVQVTGGGDDPGIGGRRAAPERHHHRAAGGGDEDAHAADWHAVAPHAAGRARRRRRDRQASASVLEGGDTELDKSVIEAIRDPLTHLVRNAVDHGIEPPAARMAQGKRAEGRLALRAYHEGGQVLIEIVDDGAGIAVERIRERAIERRLIPTVQIDRMTDRDWLQLIFLPGFSTAERVTNVSGRGVGMDVVKTNLERIGATVELATRPGEGTVFTLRIPLTLAIIPALFVRAGGEEYAIPQVNLLEIVKAGGRGRVRLERVHDAPVIRLRGQLLPIADLGARAVESSPRLDLARTGDSHTIVVVAVERRSIGLVVDEVIGTKEIVVKPVPKALSRSGVFAGATILGDGRVALILDVRGFARWAELGPPPAVQGSRPRGRRRNRSTRPRWVSSPAPSRAGAGARDAGAAPAPCDLRSDWRVAIPLAHGDAAPRS